MYFKSHTECELASLAMTQVTVLYPCFSIYSSIAVFGNDPNKISGKICRAWKAAE